MRWGNHWNYHLNTGNLHPADNALKFHWELLENVLIVSIIAVGLLRIYPPLYYLYPVAVLVDITRNIATSPSPNGWPK